LRENLWVAQKETIRDNKKKENDNPNITFPPIPEMNPNFHPPEWLAFLRYVNPAKENRHKFFFMSVSFAPLATPDVTPAKKKEFSRSTQRQKKNRETASTNSTYSLEQQSQIMSKGNDLIQFSNE
jgi:hypothetical protein